MFKRLLSIRLSYIYPSLFVIFLLILSLMQPSQLTAGQLALYSVNTFLFGFYFSPLLNSQKSRVDALNNAVRNEVMTILDILAQSHLLSSEIRLDLKIRLKAYIDSIYQNPKVSPDNVFYDELLHFTTQPKFKDDAIMKVIYDRVAKTQENRDSMQSLLTNKVFSHEWIVVSVLFSITIWFVMQTDYNDIFVFRILLAILCTGITLMLVILIKYATLTHKQAKRMWEPLRQLTHDHFEDVDKSEVVKLKAKILTESRDERVHS